MDVVKEADRQPRAEPVAAEDGAGEDLALEWPERDGGGIARGLTVLAVASTRDGTTTTGRMRA